MEKSVPASEGLSGQQGGLDVVDDVHALPPEQVAPPPEQVARLSCLLPPFPQPMVDGHDDGEEDQLKKFVNACDAWSDFCLSVCFACD
ncbi:hypothetical protein D1007_44622 [Hordeum vulgare]|nr:hypothetical protein D1007_44622 [Hordeum vulgare]